MSENTKIEWADASWSPWRGCTKVSAGCAHCYAETLSKRNPAVIGQWGKGKPRVLAKNWGDPVKWNKKEAAKTVTHEEFVNAQRPRVFPSLCDWLDDEVPIEWLARFLALIHYTPNLNWLLLSKRPENWHDRLEGAMQYMLGRTNPKDRPVDFLVWLDDWIKNLNAPANVWIGTSVEDQPNADQRIPELLKIPARLRFLSMEPMLGPVSLTAKGLIPATGDHPDLIGYMVTPDDGKSGLFVTPEEALSKSGIHWVIVGGESGPGARPCNAEWIRELIRQCAAAKVPCFVKQLGAVAYGAKDGAYNDYEWAKFIKHPKGGDPSEWPEDLRVRQMPEVKP